MGRRERPLDPAAGAAARFAYELRKLRQEAGGLTYRVMAARAHYSTATLAQAASGDRLPSLAVTLAYVGACGGDREEWQRRWHEALRAVEEEGRAAEEDTPSPYLGLARFDTGDEERFFGRDRLVDRLVELVRLQRLVVLVGPSGSGKSSLVRAGLIPRLRKAGAGGVSAVRILTPGPRPADAHGHVREAQPGTVVVVDQFEEVFTLCVDPGERARFIDMLLGAAESDRGGVRIVLAVRADFYGHLARHARLSQAAQRATLLVSPMDAEELREAVVRPAALGGLVVERTLTARIVREVAEEPGGLPLMSHALLETWRGRRGRTLTEAAYEAVGGIHGAIAHTAEDVFGRLSPGQAATARTIILRLVTPGEGAQDTRRPVERAEIAALADCSETGLVLERLARARLITLDGDTVDLAHEAVLAAWPRLRGWLDEDRDRLRAQRRLTEAAAAWEALGRDPGALYRGVRLAGAEQLLADGRGLTSPEVAFLTASAAARIRGRRRRRARATVGTVLLVLSLVASLVAWQQNRSGERRRVEAEARRIAGVSYSLQASDPKTAMRLGLAAWRIADLPETRSALLSASVQQQQDVFGDPDGNAETMRRLSADGRTLISVGADQVTWWDIDTRRRTAELPGLGKEAANAAFLRADATWLPVFDAAGRVGVRDLVTGTPMGALTAGGHGDGSAGAGAGGDGGAGGDAGTGAGAGGDAGAGGVRMGASGRTLITYDSTRTTFRVRLWDVGRRRPLLDIEQTAKRVPPDPSGEQWGHLTALRNQQKKERRASVGSAGTALPDATVSADDRHLALCVPGERLQLWDVARRRRLPAPWLPEVTRSQCLQERVGFSSDGRHLGLIGPAGFRAWDITSGRELPAVEHAGLETVELAAGGAFLAASDGKEMLVWRLGQPVPVLRHRLVSEVVKDLRIDTRAGVVRYLGGPEGSWGPTVHTLSLGRAAADRWSAVPAVAAAFSPDGRILATARGDREHVRFGLLDVRTGRRLAEPTPVSCRLPEEWPMAEDCGIAMAFDATGRIFAHGAGASGRPPAVSLYDIGRQRVRTVLGPRELGPGPWSHLSFGPDDRSLLLSGPPGPDAPPGRVRDLRRGGPSTTLPGGYGPMILRPDGGLLVTARGQAYRMPAGTLLLPYTRSPGKSTALAFSPGGEYLAVGDASGSVALWDGRLTRRLGVLPGEANAPYQFVSALAFSPDGRTLAVAGDEGTLQLWDTDSHQRIGSPLPTPGDTIRALAFDADGTLLRSAGDRTPPQSYELAPARVAAVVCRRAGGGLSRGEWEELIPHVPYVGSCPNGSRGGG
ncbi:hypothetical protein ACFZCG_24250 [Streptomyces tanashiensis]|uniref:nSTAND1 domain-containing NTPase n=1 Tax=Streptomyces tanashiensis TaxID=67367 RepID=UPI0036EA277E